MNALDGFIKGPLTSILGLLIMCASAYGWWTDYLTDWQGGMFGVIGFALLWMRDVIPTWITQFVNSVLDKFSTKKQ